MPTYEYRCKSCGHELEAVQSFTDDSLTECPACGGPLRKVFGRIGITFKGSGFYKTDSRAGAKASSSSSSDGGDDESPSESSTSDSPGHVEEGQPPSPSRARPRRQRAPSGSTSAA